MKCIIYSAVLFDIKCSCLLFITPVGLAEFRVRDQDLAREPSDPSVSSVQSVEKSPEAHNRVEAHLKVQPFRVIDLFVSYRPLLSFVSDLYFGAPLLYAAPAKIDSLLSYY